MDTLRWGILSTGHIAHQFAIGLQSAKDAKMVAVGSRNQASAEAFAKEFDIPNVHASYEALVNDPDVDAIYIGTPHVFHADNIKLCLNAGKHILCEKPITINSPELESCIALAQEKNLFLMEAMWTRFVPAIVETQKLVASGVIGDIRLIKADFSFYMPIQPEHRAFNPQLGGGALLDVGVYPIWFTTFFLGMPESVQSHAIIGESGVDEQCTMLLSYPSASALLSAGITGELRNEAVIKGTKGKIIVQSPFWVPDRITVHIYGEEAEERHIPYDGNGYNYEAEAVHKAINAGKIEHEIVSQAESIATMKMMDAMRHDWGLSYPQED